MIKHKKQVKFLFSLTLIINNKIKIHIHNAYILFLIKDIITKSFSFNLDTQTPDFKELMIVYKYSILIFWKIMQIEDKTNVF